MSEVVCRPRRRRTRRCRARAVGCKVRGQQERSSVRRTCRSLWPAGCSSRSQEEGQFASATPPIPNHRPFGAFGCRNSKKNNKSTLTDRPSRHLILFRKHTSCSDRSSTSSELGCSQCRCLHGEPHQLIVYVHRPVYHELISMAALSLPPPSLTLTCSNNQSNSGTAVVGTLPC